MQMLVCIRCHDYLDLVLDTTQSVQANTDPSKVHVVYAVDGNQTLALQLRELTAPENVFCAKTKWGWGTGLWCLLSESLQFFKTFHTFEHFQSIDYDTLYIGEGADTRVLDIIAKNPTAGLLGCRRKDSSHWRNVFQKEKAQFEKTFGQVPSTYLQGEGIQGGFMTLTSNFIEAMAQRGMWNAPFAEAKRHTMIADDHLIAIFCRMCSLDIVDVSSWAECSWTAPRPPQGIEKEGRLVFHPTKLAPRGHNRGTELQVRNYFRRLRAVKELR